MTFEDWLKKNLDRIAEEFGGTVPYLPTFDIKLAEALEVAYDDGFNEGFKRGLNFKEFTRDFDEYGNYGENNGPVGMSNPGDRDYEC